MPELPEVETVRLGLIPAMQNKRVSRVQLNRQDLRTPIDTDFADTLAGQTLTTLERRGKYIIALFDHGRGFVLHLGMSGRIEILADANAYKAAKHDHALFYIEDGGLVVLNDPRRFRMLYLCSEDWANDAPFSKMGPEPLSNHFSAPALYDAIRNKRTPIKVALLDQRVVSGVGNIYACEAVNGGAKVVH